ncbi:hypothetical protein D3C86_2117040 [compost metagenome]
MGVERGVDVGPGLEDRLVDGDHLAQALVVGAGDLHAVETDDDRLLQRADDEAVFIDADGGVEGAGAAG